MKKNVIFTALLFAVFCGCGLSTANTNKEETTEVKTTGQKEEERRRVLISTPYGDMTIELFNETPLHRDNFIKLVEEGYYNGTLFHRVIKDFMIQGGDPHSIDAAPGERLGVGGPGYTIPAEIVQGKFHRKGALAAARQGDQVNPRKESSGSQFYIVQGRVVTPEELDQFEQRAGKVFTNEQRTVYSTEGGTPHLDDEYTVFGQVVSGLEVIDKIAAVQTDSASRPVEDVRVTMEVIE
ncbi:MAG: peptidylprolyl isomerase [Bacteroidota bacterium]